MARGPYRQRPAVQALRVLVAFAEGSARDLRPLLHAGHAFASGPVLSALRSLSPPAITALKMELRAFVRDLATHDGADREGPRLRIEIVPVFSAANTVEMFVDGSARDVLLFQVATLAKAVGTARLQRCPALDCGRVFVQVGRRLFCSSRCQRLMFLASHDPDGYVLDPADVRQRFTARAVASVLKPSRTRTRQTHGKKTRSKKTAR
jgi:hypothetical protein